MRVGLDMNFSRRAFLSHGKNMEAPSEILDPTSSISTLSSTAACHTYGRSVSMSVSAGEPDSNFGKIHGPNYVYCHILSHTHVQSPVCVADRRLSRKTLLRLPANLVDLSLCPEMDLTHFSGSSNLYATHYMKPGVAVEAGSFYARSMHVPSTSGMLEFIIPPDTPLMFSPSLPLLELVRLATLVASAGAWVKHLFP